MYVHTKYGYGLEKIQEKIFCGLEVIKNMECLKYLHKLKTTLITKLTGGVLEKKQEYLLRLWNSFNKKKKFPKSNKRNICTGVCKLNVQPRKYKKNMDRFIC